MGEYTRAAYMPTDGGGGCVGGAAEPGRRVERITVEEFRLRIGAVRTRRRNAEAAFRAHDDIELGAGWSSKNHAKLEREVLEARGEELRLVHLLLGEFYTLKVGDGNPCLVDGGAGGGADREVKCGCHIDAPCDDCVKKGFVHRRTGIPGEGGGA